MELPPLSEERYSARSSPAVLHIVGQVQEAAVHRDMHFASLLPIDDTEQYERELMAVGCSHCHTLPVTAMEQWLTEPRISYLLERR